MKNSQSHLPVIGVGPIYIIMIVPITIIAVVYHILGIINYGYTSCNSLFWVIGILFILAGISLFFFSIFHSNIAKKIKANKLVTTGVYGWVRNPIYSAYMFVCIGVVLLCGNWLFLILPIIYWLFMAILMHYTEEKWLEKIYGEEYLAYKRKVNRSIPWPPFWVRNKENV